MAFFQDAPALGNQYQDDRVLRSYLTRVLPPDVRRAIEPGLSEMGELAGGELFAAQQEDRLSEPRLVSFDPWGQRIDRIELTPVWQRARRLACEKGVVAAAYEPAHGAHARVHQFALVYLFDGSTDTYTCPLAMTDGAARTLLAHRSSALVERALPRLTSRDPARAWTSGQWMTERTGGSDVGLSETVARRMEGGFRLYGTKWFTSAATSEMALTLARPEGNGSGGRGLALFYLETRLPDGRPNGILVNRLKEKLGTRKLPTAELTLDGAVATPVAELANGVKAITPMLTITRSWNAVCAAAGMRRGLALARDYARRRSQFGAALSQKPLHLETFADLQAESEGAFHLAFRAVELLGRDERGEASGAERRLLRLLTPLAKLCTARQAMEVMPEVLEVFGGAGYVEDTGLPRLLRDAQVLPIWEGTTNVLSLDVLRALAEGGTGEALQAELEVLSKEARAPALAAAAKQALEAASRAFAWLGEVSQRGREAAEAGARGVALTLARSLELALLARHGQWSIDHERDGRAAAAAARLACHGVDRLAAPDAAAAALADDRPLPV
ncbi:MAG: acyl-CoA dehydrogenase family protein [Myxococcales bacterium]